MAEARIVGPQPGYQTLALSSSADIVIGGGAAGAGKTFTLLLDPLRDINNPDFGGVIFRRTTPQITAQGGLWDESKKIYPHVGAKPNETHLNWTYPSGAKLKFSHLEHEKNVTAWQGSQIPFIGFDELTHFSQKTFFYLLSRNRSTCGVRPYVRATCNPDPDSWVYDLVTWWIGDDGFPIQHRRGVVRYFVKDGEKFIWGATMDDCIKKAKYFIDPLVKESGIKAENFVKSLTFIGGSVYENKKLLDTNPEYLANLAAQSEDDRMQLLQGNWKVSVNPADVYEYASFRDIFSNTVGASEKRIVVDVAMGGKDKLIVAFFGGHIWQDVFVIPKSSGKQVLDAIREMQRKHGVGNSKVVYDADGVGAFLGGETDGFIEGAVAFNNGGKQIDTGDKRRFANLKTQCYVYSGERCSRSGISVSESVANRMYDNKMTVRQRLIFERKAIKKKPKRDVEPEKLIPKDEMKAKYLNGSSPDLLDVLAMNEYFDIRPKTYIHSTTATADELGLF